MWTRYRRWKHWVVAPTIVLISFLMRGEPEDSVGFLTGMGMALLLGAAYIAEEMVWIVRRRGRPCEACGVSLHPKTFSLIIRCPHCGHRD